MVLVCGNYTKVYNCINNNKKKTQDQKLHENLYTWYEKTNRV